jgi:uncharacterized protein YndB with AHSA1/START domain
VSESDQRSYETSIQATPERIWQALTDPDLTEQYFFGNRVKSDWDHGSAIEYVNAEGGVDADGEILEKEDHRRLVTTFKPAWAPDVQGAPPGTVTWEIEPRDGTCTLKLTHAGFDFSSPAAAQVDQGWEMLLNGVKTLLETGSPPPPPAG